MSNGRNILMKLKKMIKRLDVSYTLYNKLFRILYSHPYIFSPEKVAKLAWYISNGEVLDLEAPKSFNEKIQWMKLYYRNPLYIKCADKLQVRSYLEEKGLGEHLNELYAVFDSIEEIDFSKLPQKFALKCTQGSGGNVICDDLEKLNVQDAKKRLKQYMTKAAGIETGEFHYQFIPRKILLEKYMDCGEGIDLTEHSIFCFNGEPYTIRANTSDGKKYCWYDFEWNDLHITSKEYDAGNIFMKPKELKKMYEIAKILCEEFPFVRVDLYEVMGQVVFGEMTFTPTGGNTRSFTKEGNLLLGEQFVLPAKSRNKGWS